MKHLSRALVILWNIAVPVIATVTILAFLGVFPGPDTGGATNGNIIGHDLD